MNVPKNLFYTESHEWVRKEEGGNAKAGITDHAQEMLGDIVYVELPETGNSFKVGEPMAVVESVKTASDVYSPISGTISAINDTLNDDPGQINESCYDAWLVAFSNADMASLLSADEYQKFLESEEDS